MCCKSGNVKLPLLQDPPKALKDLLERNAEPGTAAAHEQENFHKNICSFNAALAFTSLGVKIDRAVLNGRGPYAFRIQGALHHLSGPLEPEEGVRPSYAQLYFYDPEEALDHRMQQPANRGCDRTVMSNLTEEVCNNHQYFHLYRQAKDILREQDGGGENVTIHLRYEGRTDPRRYNLPTSDEIAVIIPGDGERPSGPRDLILRLHTPDNGRTYDRISAAHPAYLCLNYPLLFIYGEHCWHPNIPLRDESLDIPPPMPRPPPQPPV